jgi:MbtH protein
MEEEQYNMFEDDSGQCYDVVLNDEGQYSIWPVDYLLPLGWRRSGFAGDKATCLTHITEVWIDMVPRSLRERVR